MSSIDVRACFNFVPALKNSGRHRYLAISRHHKMSLKVDWLENRGSHFLASPQGDSYPGRMADLTHILSQIESGDDLAAQQLLPLVYDELRKLAAAKLMLEKSGQTLQPTALVHEAYIRLVKENDQPWNGRGHFFAAAAQAMRRILVESARHKQRLKHGGQLRRVELEPIALPALVDADELLALDAALERLAASEPVIAQLVQLRHFGGLTIQQAAETLGISVRTANRHWAYAKAWLFQQLQGESNEEKK